MQNTRFLKIIITVLAVLNISTLAFILLGNKKGPPPQGPGNAFEFLSKELNLDATQVKQYDEMRKAHHEEAMRIREKSHAMHNRFFNLLHTQNDSNMIKQLSDSIAIYQVQMELLIYNHFKQVRAICKPGQQKKFDAVINQALEMITPKPAGPPHPER